MSSIQALIDKYKGRKVYWKMIDDGASFTCSECEGKDNGTKMVLAQTPNGNRVLAHPDCLDQDWLKSAEFLGTYPG